MAGQRNAEIARELWIATSRGDADAIRALFSENIVWVVRSGGDLSGEVKGREAAVMLMARAGEDVDELHSTLLDVYSSETGVVLRYRVEAERSGELLDTEILLVAEIEDEQVQHVETVPVDPERNVRFWTSQ